MKLRRKGLMTVHLKKHGTFTDEYKETYTGYSQESEPLKMNVQPAGGSLNAQIYGEKLAYMKAGKYQGSDLVEGQNEKDGLCIYVDPEEEPDYKIISIQTFSDHINLMLERL